MMTVHEADSPRQVIGEVDCEALAQGTSVHTRRAYRRWIREYIEEKLPGTVADWRHISAARVVPILSVAEFKMWLGKLKERDLGRQSLNQAHAALVFLCRCLADTYPEANYHVLLGNLKGVELPKAETGRRRRTWYDQNQVAQLLKTASQTNSTSVISSRNMAMLMLMVLCGLRRNEIVSARWSDLSKQGENAILQVHGKGAHLRQVKVPSEVVDVLLRWRSRQSKVCPSDVMFTRIRRGNCVTPEGLSTQAVMNVVKTAAKEAGLPVISPHDLRRTLARGAYEAGASFELIRQTLGHSSVESTERYINATLELKHAATDIMVEGLKRAAQMKQQLNAPNALPDVTLPKPKIGSDVFPVSPDQCELLTRGQAAKHLGISISQFDTLKKRAKIEAVRSTEEYPTTNAKTRPFSMYRREDVETLIPKADRLRRSSAKALFI